MVDFLGGTSVATPRDIANRLNGSLVIPDFEGAANAAPPQAPQPTPQARPNVILNPAPQPQYVPNPLTEVAEEDDASINFPQLFEDETPSEPQTTVEAPVEEDIDADLPDTPAAENFKKLRGVVKTERQAKREIEARLQETAAKLEKYEKGEIVPEIIRAKDERIAQLEPYEKIVDLRNSREYQQSFVEPMIARRKHLEQIGADYGLPPEVMHRAVGIENRKELNQFLSRHFDDVGGLEVKRIVQEMQDLGEKAIQAEAEPEVSLQTIRSQFIEAEQKEMQRRAQTFDAVAKDGWGRALEKTKNEGAYKELYLHPTDTEFNKRIVEPIQHEASIQYGTLVKKLSQYGLKELPSDFAAQLARMVLLSIGGALTMDAKVHAERKANSLIQNNKRTNGYQRPTIGGQNGSGHSTRGSAPQQRLNPQSAAEAAARVFNK